MMKLFFLNVFYFLVFLIPSLAQAQADYFYDENKAEGLAYYKSQIYSSCRRLKKPQVPISTQELERLTQGSYELVSTHFKQAFSESPKIQESFRKDLTDLKNDKICQLENNDCRARVLALSLFYIHLLRPDLPQCQGDSGKSKLCDIEKKYRRSNFQGVRDGQYGVKDPGTYKKILLNIKNDLALDLFKFNLAKDQKNLHICEPVTSGVGYQIKIEMDNAGESFIGTDPYKPKAPVAECSEKEIPLLKEFFQLKFDKTRSTVGQDQVEPVKIKVEEFLKAHPEFKVTHIRLTTSSSRAPYPITLGGKKMMDPKSLDRNMELANQRAAFLVKSFADLRKKSPYSSIQFEFRSEVSGPEFSPLDMNSRFVTRMTSGYTEKLEALYQGHQKEFEEKALKNSSKDLLNEEEFPNLYLAKFKPFQGIRIEIFGVDENKKRCLVPSSSSDDHKVKAQ